MNDKVSSELDMVLEQVARALSAEISGLITNNFAVTVVLAVEMKDGNIRSFHCGNMPEALAREVYEDFLNRPNSSERARPSRLNKKDIN